MDAGTAAAATQKGRLRQQLLNGENGVNIRSQEQNQYPQQFQQPHQNYDNHNMMAPNVGYNTSNSRKASLTSQSGVNKLFRRNKSSGGAAFNDDVGVDIQDLTSGSNFSFDDISHIPDRGPYGLGSSRTLGTTPIIPTIGAGIGSSTKTMNNIQYRKQMNHNKKLALASGARAMSLAGGNPMQQQPLHADPRTMSFNSYSAGARTMSLHSNSMMMQGAPRTMSLNNRIPLNGSHQAGPNGPRSMSMRSNGGQFNSQFGGPSPYPSGPGTMSLMNGPSNQPPNSYSYHQPQPFVQQGVHQQYPNNPRTMSLNSGNYNQYQNQIGGTAYKNLVSPTGPSYNQNFQVPPVGSRNQQQQQSSNDSLMNVVEEEEEENKSVPSNIKEVTDTSRRIPPTSVFDTKQQAKESSHDHEGSNNNVSLPTSSPIGSDREEEDVVYKFDKNDESEVLPRKSTLKKSNSMRLRKLNLFDNDQYNQSKVQEENLNEENTESHSRSFSTSSVHTNINDLDKNEIDTSPSFNVKQDSNNRESVINDENDEAHRREHRDKLKLLGANATINSSNATTLTKDIFITASDFYSPTKEDSNLPSPNIQDNDDETIVGFKKSSPLKNSTFDEDKDEDFSLKERGSPVHNEKVDNSPETFKNNKSLFHQPSIRSLVANTAFSSFRSPSTRSNQNISELPKSSEAESNNVSSIIDKPHNEFEKLDSSSSSYTEKSSEIIEGPATHLDSKESYSQAESFDKIILTNSRENFGNSTSPTTNASNNSTSNYNSYSTTSNTTTNTTTNNFNRYDSKSNEISIRNNSELLDSPVIDDASINSEMATTKKEKKASRNFSFTSKSKNIFKRLSKSGKRSSVSNHDDDTFSNYDTSFSSSRNSFVNNSYNQSPNISQNHNLTSNSSTKQQPQKNALKFSKEELGIMNCNSDLLNELQLVTTELASSIKRELALESKLKNNYSPQNQENDLHNEITNKVKMISELQDKLNKERKLRFISEEHALLLENGQSPNPLKLNYEKTELYKQLLIKNDLVYQLQDKINEYEGNMKENNQNLLDKYNELLKENTELKFTVIPELEKKIASKFDSPNRSTSGRQLSLVNVDLVNEYDESQEEITVLRNQREELREVVTKLTSTHNYELKNAQDKTKTLEAKLQYMKSINEKLSKRVDHGANGSANSSSSNLLGNSKGGKLQGFTIVSPTKKFFED